MKKVVTNTVVISASPVRVWEVLTRPEETRKYMFGCETVSDWTTGSTLEWEMEHEGNPMVPVTGTILEIDAPRKLVYTVISPTAPYPPTPENHLTVAYELVEEDGKTRFTVSQYGFEDAADGEKRYAKIYNNGDGWAPMLDEIRKVAEGS